MKDQNFLGTVVLPDRVIENGFVHVADGVVRMVGEGPPPSGEKHGGPGMLVLPGAIDALLAAYRLNPRDWRLALDERFGSEA